MSFRRYCPGIFIILASLFLSGCATAAGANDAPRKIIAIGDLHGDYDAYQNLLREAGLINKRGRWTGGDAIFVQTGDVPDRGPNSLKIIEHLQKLQKQASRKGGKVVTLVGNHEAMNMIGDLRYVHPGEYEAFADSRSSSLRDRIYEANREIIEQAYLERDSTLSSEAIREQWMAQTPLGMIEHQRAWRPDGEVGAWIAANPAVAVVGDTLFVHGGISEKYTAFSVDEMNSMTAEALAERSLDPESIINDPLGPLWYRGLIRRESVANEEMNGEPAVMEEATAPLPEAISIEDEINLVLSTYGVARIVVGHTPSLTGIAAHQGGKLIQIDTGISDYYGGTQSFLSIEGDKIYAHDNGAVTQIGGDQ